MFGKHKRKVSRTPLVSVIIPNYNHARYLEQRLDSVFNQTYQNFEVVFLDDCSTDNSLEIIEKYKDNPHLRQVVVNQTNSGNTFSQWDKGIRLAKGELVWIAESDDFCELSLLGELVKAFCSYSDVAISYAPVVFVDGNGEQIGYYSKEWRNQFFNGQDFVIKHLALHNVIYNASCAIFSREKALAIGTEYRQYIGVGDWWFWVKLAEKGNVSVVNKHLSYFRRHEGVVTWQRAADGTNALGFYELLSYLRDRYSIPKWREDYIVYSNPWIVDGIRDSDIKQKVVDVWDYNRHYSKLELFCFRCFNHFLRKYLFYI